MRLYEGKREFEELQHYWPLVPKSTNPWNWIKIFWYLNFQMPSWLFLDSNLYLLIFLSNPSICSTYTLIDLIFICY